MSKKSKMLKRPEKTVKKLHEVFDSLYTVLDNRLFHLDLSKELKIIRYNVPRYGEIDYLLKVLEKFNSRKVQLSRSEYIQCYDCLDDLYDIVM